MFNMIYDFLLIVVFLITFKLYDIYVATGVIIAGAAIQVLITRLVHKRYDKKQIILLGLLLVFGGMTIYFHNSIFIKWKPTIVFWLMSLALLSSHFFGKQTLIQRVMGHVFEGKYTVPGAIWKKLNMAWTCFFILLGSINVFVAYYFTDAAWVNFKVYGVLSSFVVFAIAQSVYLSRFLAEEK